jgi:hypothetical protein
MRQKMKALLKELPKVRSSQLSLPNGHWSRPALWEKGLEFSWRLGEKESERNPKKL